MRHWQGKIVSGPESSPSFTNWRDKASGFTLVGDASLSSYTPSFYDLSNQERIHHCQCHNFSAEDDERSTRMPLIIDRKEHCDRTASIPTLENPPVSGQSFGRKNCHVLRSPGELADGCIYAQVNTTVTNKKA